MNTISLDKRKKNVIKYIEKINDDSVLNKFETLLKKVSTKPPCQYTNEELRDQIRQSEIDFNNGLGISHEEVRKRFLAK